MACFISSFAPPALLSSSSFSRARSLQSPRRAVAQPSRCEPAPARRRAAPTAALLPAAAPAATQAATTTTATAQHLLLLADFSDVNRGPLFATAFVFFLTFWGSISFVKGSTKDRITQASFSLAGTPAPDAAKSAAAYLMRRSFKPDAERDTRPGVMTFVGEVRASSSVASILVAVAASAIWAATYILNFILPPALHSDYWWLLTLGSFAVVPWYWRQANREEYVKLMVEEQDDDPKSSTVYVKGHRDEIEEMEKAFGWKRNEPVYEGDEDKAKQPATPEPVVKE